jgi:transposase
MKDRETVERFIELRAEGKSFDKIVKLLNVSKPTLIEWDKKHSIEIANLKEIRYEQILEKYKLTQEDRITQLAKELNIAWKYFELKDYENLSKREIMAIIMRLEESLRKEQTMFSISKKKSIENKPPEGVKIILRRSIIGQESVRREETVRTVVLRKEYESDEDSNEKVYFGTYDEVTEMIKEAGREY